MRTVVGLQCERCGNGFYTTPTQRRAGRGRFCSVSCANAARRQTPEGWKARRAIKKRTEYRHHDRAREAVSRAVRAGKLLRAPCEECSAEKAHAHHEDYDKPLEVRWLCPKCHKRRDKELGRTAN